MSKNRTANKLFNRALETLENVDLIREEKGVNKEVKEGYSFIANDLKEALLFGKDNAAYILAYLHCEGYGVKKDIEKAKLWIAIGNEVGNANCAKLIRGEDPGGSIDVFKYINKNSVFSKGILEKATAYAKSVKVYTDFIRSVDAEISDVTLLAAINLFDNADPSHTLHILGDDAPIGNGGGGICVIL